MRLACWVAMILLGVSTAACSSSDSEATGTDSGIGGAAGAAGGGGTGGVAGNSGSAGTAGAAGEDAGPSAESLRSEASSYATETIPCTQDSDCCVVFDGCLAEGFIVSAEVKDKVSTLFDQAQAVSHSCLNCIPPSVQAYCEASFCRGARITCEGLSAPQEGRMDHCGKVTVPTGCTQSQAKPSWEDPGLHPQTSFGCGP